MKRNIVLLFLIVSLNGWGQQISIAKGATDSVNESSKNDRNEIKVYIPVDVIENRQPANGTTFGVRIPEYITDITGVKLKDENANIIESEVQYSPVWKATALCIIILNKPIKKDVQVYIFTNEDVESESNPFSIKISPTPVASPPSPSKKTKSSKSTTANSDSIDNFNITFLNAANFDFSGKFSVSYLGMLNIFAPNIKGTNWGFNTGIEKINYSNGNINGNDSTQIQYYYQNILSNPLSYNGDSVTIGAKYTSEYNKYTFSSSNTVWGYYIQPLFRLSKNLEDGSDSKVGIYVHLHGELLVNEFNRTANIQTIAQDTGQIVGVGQSRDEYYKVLVNPVVINYTFLSGYFGAGTTFYLRPFNEDTSTHFFFQQTIGFAINTPNFDSLYSVQKPPQPNGLLNVASATNAKAKAFYLIKAIFTHTISSTSQIVIGATIRGLFPTLNPQYAVYAGLNLSLPALIKAITGS